MSSDTRKNGVMADAGTLRIPFSLRGIGGLTNISISRNTDPEAIGYTVLSYGLPADFARDFPVCRATASYPADGYAAIFGWTQLVRSTDNASGGLEMDPIAIYRDVATPFAWYGIRPELFDAPSRDPRANMDWEAHSFLCISPDAVLTRQVRAITGFSWGFTITRDQIDLTQPAILDPQAWNEHLALRRTDCPGGASRLGFLIPDRGMGPAPPNARHNLSVSGRCGRCQELCALIRGLCVSAGDRCEIRIAGSAFLCSDHMLVPAWPPGPAGERMVTGWRCR